MRRGTRDGTSLVEREHDCADEGLRLSDGLPRGRHALSAEEVSQHQRERVAAAVAQVVSEIGYGSVTVERLHREAGISRSTFYQHFANKREAVMASYDLFFDRFCDHLAARCGPQRDFAGRVRTAIAAAVDLAVHEPEKAQLLSGMPMNADPELASHVFETHDRLATMLCDEGGSAAEPDLVLTALLGAVTQVLARRLAAPGPEGLPGLEARLVELVLGASAAERCGRVRREDLR